MHLPRSHAHPTHTPPVPTPTAHHLDQNVAQVLSQAAAVRPLRLRQVAVHAAEGVRRRAHARHLRAAPPLLPRRRIRAPLRRAQQLRSCVHQTGL